MCSMSASIVNEEASLSGSSTSWIVGRHSTVPNPWFIMLALACLISISCVVTLSSGDSQSAELLDVSVGACQPCPCSCDMPWRCTA